LDESEQIGDEDGPGDSIPDQTEEREEAASASESATRQSDGDFVAGSSENDFGVLRLSQPRRLIADERPDSEGLGARFAESDPLSDVDAIGWNRLAALWTDDFHLPPQTQRHGDGL
jgi:hypothetical protein